ncbi:MAG: DNA-protecting protein DprA [Candidatus Eisenbacteria bacterium]|uniref:DNA-protecting protein DprA n=1 Tax=Eiseniibacteriota bacterium TaxID=2212470 RepID=A0A538U697_UNCEI|nr:MAG: DNA-protecting protein DprA [Candidatus Eisenbacteria bacterium]
MRRAGRHRPQRRHHQHRPGPAPAGARRAPAAVRRDRGPRPPPGGPRRADAAQRRAHVGRRRRELERREPGGARRRGRARVGGLDRTPGQSQAPPGRTGSRALRRDDPQYPAGLRELSHPPPCVWALGAELPAVARAVAVVGSRAASRYGLDQAARLAHDLARLGLVVVSGLARGIDAAAHRAALAAGGRTVAVLPAGLDAITPRHHRPLAAEIARQGTLLTEWERGEPAGKGVFVQRNRLIAALAGATVVVEAAVHSGALTTAAFALRLGRPVLAVPGDVDRETARGVHGLIRGGA